MAKEFQNPYVSKYAPVQKSIFKVKRICKLYQSDSEAETADQSLNVNVAMTG